MYIYILYHIYYTIYILYILYYILMASTGKKLNKETMYVTYVKKQLQGVLLLTNIN